MCMLQDFPGYLLSPGFGNLLCVVIPHVCLSHTRGYPTCSGSAAMGGEQESPMHWGSGEKTHWAWLIGVNILNLPELPLIFMIRVGFAVSFCVFNGSLCGRGGMGDRRIPTDLGLWGTACELCLRCEPCELQNQSVPWALKLHQALPCPVERLQFLVIPVLLLWLHFMSREAQLYNLPHLSVIASDTWRPSDCQSSWYIMNLLDMQRSLCHKRFSHYIWAFTCLSRVSKPSPSPHSQWEKCCRKLPFSSIYIRKGPPGCKFSVLFAACRRRSGCKYLLWRIITEEWHGQGWFFITGSVIFSLRCVGTPGRFISPSQ